MRSLKIFGIAVGGLLVLFVLLLVGVAVFVNPNDYKGRIAQQVKASTGRDLVLKGDIKLSVFPWIALELGPASLGNPSGFDEEPFLALQRAALRVRLLPLLHKQLQVGRIEIDGLDLRLKKNAAGKGNWEDFGRKPGAEQPAPASGGSAESLQELGGILIKDGRIGYDKIVLSDLNVDIGNVSQRAAVPVKASFNLDTGPSGNQLRFASEFYATLDTEAKRFGLTGMTLSGDLTLHGDGRALPWKVLAAAADLDLAAQTLKLAHFSAQAGAAQLSGALDGEKIVDAPALRGSIKLEPLVLREFASRIGLALPKTRDQKALSMLALSTDFSYALNQWHLTKLDVQLDDSKLSGELGLTNPETFATTFNLNVDRIDLDRYLAPKAAAANAEPAAAQTPQRPTDLPTTAVRSLDTQGTFSIGAAEVAGMSVSNLRLGLKAREGLVHLAPIRANLYGGQYSGDIVYDARGNVPALQLTQAVTGVDIAGLLKDGIKSERLSGRGNASAKLAGQGRTSDALLKNLSGRVEANLVNGAVAGVDLWYEISRAQALLKQQSMPAGGDDKRTKFDTFKMSADVAGGVASTKDLTIASQYLRVTGTGSANLISKAIDYHILATILKAPPTSAGANLGELTLAGIPVEISGTMDDPKVRPDLAAALKSNLKQKLQDTLKDKLKGLFGK